MAQVKNIIKEFIISVFVLIAAAFILYLLMSKTIHGNSGFGINSNSSLIKIVSSYFSWVNGIIFHESFGSSISYNEPVSRLINNGFNITGRLVFFSVPVTVIISFIIAYYSASNPFSKIIKIISESLSVLSFMPVFLLAVIIRPFWIKEFGMLNFQSSASFFLNLGFFAVPIIILSVGDGALADMIKQFKNIFDNILSENYIKAIAVRNAGTFRHVLKHFIISAASVILSRFSYILGGAIIIEFIFYSRGIGILALEALRNRDVNVILAIAFVFSIIIICANLFGKLLTLILDPRLSKE